MTEVRFLLLKHGQNCTYLEQPSLLTPVKVTSKNDSSTAVFRLLPLL